MKPTINGHYDPAKQELEWAQERREYPRCGYNAVCRLYREKSELCEDHSEECPIKRNLALLIKRHCRKLVSFS